MADGSGTAHLGAIHPIDTMFLGYANHHGTLFGGAVLAHMDKITFVAACRQGRAPLVTASSEKIDFATPARIGDLIIASAQIVRVGHSSLDVAVDLVTEGMTSANRRPCTPGTLHARRAQRVRDPPASAARRTGTGTGGRGRRVRIIDKVLPPQTNHYGRSTAAARGR